MNSEIKEKVYLLSLVQPSQKEIAKQLNLSEATVSRAINSVTKSNDYKLAMMSISNFLTEYMRASDFFKYQISQLEEMKKKYPESELQLMDAQMERMQHIIQLAGQGKVVMALQALRDGQLQLQSNSDSS